MSGEDSTKKISTPKLTKSELELGLKWDRCLQDSLIKVGSGIGLGIVFSVVLFRSISFKFSIKSYEYCIGVKFF
jgi:hypothetical protein